MCKKYTLSNKILLITKVHQKGLKCNNNIHIKSQQLYGQQKHRCNLKYNKETPLWPPLNFAKNLNVSNHQYKATKPTLLLTAVNVRNNKNWNKLHCTNM